MIENNPALSATLATIVFTIILIIVSFCSYGIDGLLRALEASIYAWFIIILFLVYLNIK